MTTWILVLLLWTSGKYGASAVVLDRYPSETECKASGEEAYKTEGYRSGVQGWICIKKG